MIDNFTLIFTSLMIALVLIRATRLDRIRPWFEIDKPDATPKPEKPAKRGAWQPRTGPARAPVRDPWDDVRR